MDVYRKKFAVHSVLKLGDGHKYLDGSVYGHDNESLVSLEHKEGEEPVNLFSEVSQGQDGVNQG